MYTEQFIRQLVDMVVEQIKPFNAKFATIRGRKPKWEDIPEYWNGYRRALKYMRDIKVHSEIGEFPEELFAVRAPNQTEKEAAYIKANYKQNTLPVFVDYASTMTRPFFDGNWSIDYQESRWADKYVSQNITLQDYVEGEVTHVGSLENYMKQVVAQTKAVDANGVIAIKPKTIPTILVEGEDGEPQLEVDNSVLFEPVPIYYSTEQKLAFIKNKYYLIHTDEKSRVLYSGKMMAKGHVFEFYDDTNIWRIEQTGNYVDYQFDFFVYFQHNWERVPVIELQGIPQVLDSNSMIWISPFHYAVPNLNSALISTQYLNASKDKTMFPYLVMVGRPCTFEYQNKDGQLSKCVDGAVYDSDLQRNIECPECKGTGQKDRVSPFGVMLLNPDNEFNKGDANLGQKAMYYVSPDPVALEFVRDGIIKDFEDARKILHQQTSNSTVKGTENLTATGMTLDTKAMFAFVKTPSDQMFAIWEFMLDAIGWMRYGPDYVKAVLVNPVSFDYNTDTDYLLQIAGAQQAGLPPFVIHSIIFRYLQTLYYNERERAAVFSLIISTDRLLTLSQQDIMLKYTRQLCENWEVILHDSAINLIGDLVLANPDFFEQDLATQQEQLIDRAKQETPASQTPALQQANVVQRVLEA